MSAKFRGGSAPRWWALLIAGAAGAGLCVVYGRAWMADLDAHLDAHLRADVHGAEVLMPVATLAPSAPPPLPMSSARPAFAPVGACKR